MVQGTPKTHLVFLNLLFGCGELDLKQWASSSSKPCGVPFSEMVTFIRMDPDTKLGMISCLLELCNPTFRDKTVFILTFLLGILDFEDDDEVREGIIYLNRVIFH